MILAHSYAGLYVIPMMTIVGIIVSVNVKNLQQIVLVLFKMEIFHADVSFGTMRQESKNLDEAETIDSYQYKVWVL